MRVAIIGCGEEGTRFAHAAQRYGWEIAVCADVDERRAKRLAKPFDATPSTRCNVVIGQKKIDAVIVASPTPSHAAYVERAANARKPVLCAAPFSLDPKAASNALEAVKKTKTPHYIAYDNRVHVAYIAMSDANRPGFNRWSRAFRRAPMPTGAGRWYRDYSQSGGVIGCDLANEMDHFSTSKRIRSVFCQSLRRPAVDFAALTLVGSENAMAQFVASWADPKGATPRCVVDRCGPEGMLRFDSTDTTFQAASRSAFDIGENPTSRSLAFRHMEQFADRVAIAVADATQWQMDRHVVIATDAAIRSAESGKAIAVPGER